nr:MAG TPA: hypothetical protein [Caudoviricetes sp.]
MSPRLLELLGAQKLQILGQESSLVATLFRKMLLC